MKTRIIKTEDGYTFVDATEHALALWDSNNVELFELNNDLTESLITSEKRLKEVLELGKMVVVEGGNPSLMKDDFWNSYGVFCMSDRLLAFDICDIDNDLDARWSKAIREYEEFLGSKFNVDTKSELDCIDEYLNNK
jgi:hypothetical protein